MTPSPDTVARRPKEPTGQGALRVEHIEDRQALRALMPEWRSLEQRAGLRLPFQTATWAAAWFDFFAEDRALIRDSVRVRVLRSADGRLVGVAPMVLTERPAHGPLRARCLQFIGTDPGLTELRGPLCEPGTEVEVYRALLADAQAHAGEWDWAVWSGFSEGTPVEALLATQPRLTWQPPMPGYVVGLAPSFEELRARLPRNLKESLRKCYNSLKRDGHEFTFEVAREGAALQEALDVFFDLHGARASVEGTVGHRDAFASAPARGFLRRVVHELAEQGRTRIFGLRIGGKVVATRVAFVCGDHLYLYYSGYDPAWARYSVMTTVVAESFKYAIAEGLAAVNLSFGADVSKARWRPDETTFVAAVQMAPGLRPALSRSAFRLAEETLRLGPLSILGKVFMRDRRRAQPAPAPGPAPKVDDPAEP